jgi:pyrroline-5-carboxylate reductase
VVARLLIVGGGNMGTALARGLLGAGWSPDSFGVVEADATRRSSLGADLPEIDVRADPVPADGAVIAVKPSDGEGACSSLAGIDVRRVVSVMAGVPLARLESWLGPDVAVVRAMPNVPALVGAAMTAISGGFAADTDDLEWAEEVLGAVGHVVRVPEASLDAVTGLSGSGPAYLFYVAEAMVRAGVGVGLPEAVSRELVIQTFVGSARLLLESGEAPELLRSRVTSPGGTTEAGLAVLADRDVAEAFSEAVARATERSRDLGS